MAGEPEKTIKTFMKDLDKFLNEIGADIADVLPLDFHGNIQFNINGGKYMGYNININGKPPKQ